MLHRARDDGTDDFVWVVTFAAWYEASASRGHASKPAKGSSRMKRAANAPDPSAATSEPLAEVAEFLAAFTVRTKGSALGASELFERYQAEQPDHHWPQLSQCKFGRTMGQVGTIEKTRNASGHIVYCGLAWQTGATTARAA